jgi:hypothetical protein
MFSTTFSALMSGSAHAADVAEFADTCIYFIDYTVEAEFKHSGPNNPLVSPHWTNTKEENDELIRPNC